ncbi:MAG: hypothetical protein KAH23_04650 [Kiritimatiellae bacterium]|nr:hypothetical protein [Kiritimatiellia bacterium]
MANGTEEVKQPSTIEELPDSSVAEKTVGQPLHQAAGSAVTLEDILSSSELKEYIDKQVKSQQDVRLGKYGTRLDEAESAIAKYEALVTGGMKPEEAKAKIKVDKELDDKMARLDAMISGNAVNPSTGVDEPSWAEKQATILDSSGIAKDDSRIVELLRTSKSKQEFLASLEEQTFAWKQADANKPQPSSSTVAQIIPSVVAEKGALDAYNDEQLGGKLIDLLREPSKNAEQIAILDKELKVRDAKKG